MQVYIYARKHVCKYASMQLCKYASMQVCKYESLQVCKNESMHVYTDFAKLCKGMTRYSMIKPYIASLCKSIVGYGQLRQSYIKIYSNYGKLLNFLVKYV